ncbi:MAG: thiamine pyrophosphate-dependent enzyme [Fimbriimonadaceae bacterium]
MPKQATASDLVAPKEDLIRYYREMIYLRHFEEKCNYAYRQGKAGGYLHVYIGMEPLVVGWLNNIRKGYDYVMTAYRDHGHALQLGSDPTATMAEIMGRSGGLSRGKGGSMHLYDIANQFYGGWGIVGGHTALAGGLALAAKYRKEDRVTLCYLGDGASNAGVFFETMNMCGLWDLPIIFIIENNLYAMGTALERHAADPELYKRGFPFKHDYERVDGHDMVTVLEDSKRIIDRCRETSKPCLVEAMTWRNVGHGAADNDRQLYRTKAEEDEMMKRDCLYLYEKYLLDNNVLTRAQMDQMDAEELEKAEQVYDDAAESPHPDIEEVYSNVYTDMEPEKGH